MQRDQDFMVSGEVPKFTEKVNNQVILSENYNDLHLKTKDSRVAIFLKKIKTVTENLKFLEFIRQILK